MDIFGHFWTFCISYIDGSPSVSSTSKPINKKRIDYKEVLNEEDFNKFAALRELRKTMAEKKGVPVYTVFTNEQLAEMVQGKALTLTQLQAIEGVGKSRLEKYGEAFVSCLHRLFNET